MTDSGVEERLLAPQAKDESNLKARIWVESKKIWSVTFSAILSRITAFGMLVVTQAFIGHISNTQLAAYAITQIIGFRFANGLIIGMSCATETLCGQAFGAKQYHMLGIYLQRSWIITVAITTLIVPVFVFSGPIFKLLGEEDEIADAAGYISLWFIPIIYGFALNCTAQNYLQSQIKNKIVAWLSSMSFALHIIVSWLFVSIFDWGITGAMIALVISNWLVTIGELVYIFGGWLPDTWKGFTMVAFTDLWHVVKLSASSGMMICLELWYYSVLVVLAGYMKNASVAISAFSICLNILGLEITMCLGFLTGASVRVSNELGAGNAKATKFSIKVIIGTSVSIGIVLCILCLVFGREIAYIFTSDEEVVDSVESLSVLLAFSILIYTVQTVLLGVAIGSGRQKIVAYVNIGCYYVIGVPIGVVLGYVAKLQIKGIWTGMLIGIAIQTMVIGFITWRTNWEEEVNKASERLSKLFKEDPEDSNGSSIGRLNHE